MFHAAFQIHNTTRLARRFRILARPGKLEELRPLLETLGRPVDLAAKGEIGRIGFVTAPCPSSRSPSTAGRAPSWATAT